MHKTSGRWRLGLALSLVTVATWGILPIFLRLLLEAMDAPTITWYRFLMAAVFTVLLLLRTGKLPKLRGMSRVTLGLIVLSIAGLCGNYICFLLGLDRMTAASAQIVIQLGPLFLLLGSLVVFREAFSWRQGVGVVVFVIGLLLFFNQRMDQLFDGGSVYGFGALLIVVASASWSIYALAQKQLLRTYSSTQILLILYLAAVVVYTPTAKPAGILELNGFQLFLLLFTGANVIVAYGCFTEAMAHWEASRVSAVLAMVPLVTLAAVEFCEAFVPWLARSEGLNALGWLGALMVVGGSMQCALGRKKEKKSELGELAPGE
ncbi:MAG: drug/metabolite transporter (DMT)-like permease [Candidatus Binatia bacterium]